MSNNLSSTSTSVGIRLANDLIAEVDALVAAGLAESRSALVRRAVELGIEQLQAQHDNATGKAQRGRRSGSKATGATAAEAASAAAPAQSLEAFSASVIDAAKLAPSNLKFGEDRIMISRAWRAWKAHGGALDLESFKAKLVVANRERHLSLVCADMAPMMISENWCTKRELLDSTIQYLSATFHLLCIPLAER